VRTAIACLLMVCVAISSLAAFAARPSVPKCCIKAHGCTMHKRAAGTCAFASCDQSETGALAARPPLAILIDKLIVAEQASSTLHAPMIFPTLRLRVTSIDHPPRFLAA